MTRRAAGSVLAPFLRVLAVAALLTLVVVPAFVPRAAAGEPGSGSFVQIRIDRISPTVISTSSESVVTVAGVVTNVGDRPVRDVMVRLEHAPEVRTAAGLRTNLAGPVEQYEPVADFITVAPELDQGQRVPFTLAYAVRSANRPSLGITAPGIYPALVNVNGTPDYGAPARLDDARFLLPVLGVPADPTTDSGDVLADVVPPDTSRPVRLTVLWPLADKPRLAAGIPGGTTPVRLADDDLATSLAKGGRLDNLLTAADFATSTAVDPGGQMRSAMCIVVDPDLLVTVNAMTAGYVVSTNPSEGMESPTQPGTGQDAAIDWLGRLKTLVQRTCVAPSVYAHADLGALQRIGDPGLSTTATNDAGDIVDQILNAKSVRGATMLGDEPLTGPVVGLLSSGVLGNTVAITAGRVSPSSNGTGPAIDLTPRRYTPSLTSAPFDPSVAAALASAGSDPTAPSYLDAALAVPVKGDSEVARRQDALGALLWRGLRPEAEPRTQLLVPPLNWDLSADDAQAILTTIATSINAGLSVPRPLTAVIAETTALPAQPVAPLPEPTPGNPNARIADAVVASAAGVVGRVWGLTAALTDDPRTGLTGPQYTAPLREDVLRAVSQSVPADARNGLAEQRIRTVNGTTDDLFHAVTAVSPGDSYTLATERSPLLLALRNDLPVPIRVRLDIDAPPGMTVSDMGEIELPPGYLPLQVPIEVHFTQRVAVDVALRTADGLPLGEPVRLSVHSNAYGKVLFYLTLSAGAVLVLLAGRRLWHRFRGQPDRADLDRPPQRDRAAADPLDTAIAHGSDET